MLINCHSQRLTDAEPAVPRDHRGCDGATTAVAIFSLPAMPYAVELHNVTKSFGGQVAVDDLSVAVPEGTIYGFIGPNGSGKTTTLRMIMRILFPDSGQLHVLGETSRSAADDRVGYLPEERGLYKRMKVREVLRFFAELKGLRPSRPAVDDWLSRLGLGD